MSCTLHSYIENNYLTRTCWVLEKDAQKKKHKVHSNRGRGSGFMGNLQKLYREDGV